GKSRIDGNSHFVPTTLHSLLLGAAGAIYLASNRKSEVSGGLEVRVSLQPCRERHISNAACLFPRIPTNPRSSEIEGMLWNSRIDVHTAVIDSGVQILRLVGRM